MTAIAARVPAGRYGFRHVARMEWIKLRSLRSTWWTLAITAAGTVGIGVAVGLNSRNASEDLTNNALAGVVPGLLLVGALCAPFGWFFDESVLLPAVLTGIYRAIKLRQPLWPLAVFAGVALAELLLNVQVISRFYLWTTPAWLGWYLYATGRLSMRRAVSA